MARGLKFRIKKSEELQYVANTKALISCAVILFVGVDWYHLSNVMRKPAFAYRLSQDQGCYLCCTIGKK